MKKIVFILLCSILLLSCSNNDETESEEYSQIWQLTKMTGSVPNSETTGGNMEWQEFYVLNLDGTFLKSRERNNVLINISGTYTYENISEEKFIMSNYQSESAIIENCTSELEEYLIIRNNKFIGTSSACDGTGLEYERLKICGTK
ncbi:hypothetical protein [Lutibacter sp.]|uniref:hypothetical protein n=1 Tax=Lutibacter sp. TaxID=1925666 RepID=UPI00273372C7|nr:hypothetical protein [Lutibacter sp.]MDP3314067.1 hypothetical protein [Lutibacter sp.]